MFEKNESPLIREQVSECKTNLQEEKNSVCNNKKPFKKDSIKAGPKGSALKIYENRIDRKRGLLTPEEVMDYLKIKKSTLYDWVYRDKIGYIKIGRLLRFRWEDVEKKIVCNPS